MTHNLDLHDTFSVIIPGACALCLAAYFCCDDWADCVKLLSDLSVGGSIIFLAFSYICGEFLQALGQFSLKQIFRLLFGGEPLLWVVPKLVNKDDETMCEYNTKLLSEPECRDILQFLRKECGCDNISKEQMGSLFSHIKTTVYAKDVYRTECIKMLTKANYYSTMSVLLFLNPVIYLTVSAFRESADVFIYDCCDDLCFICFSGGSNGVVNLTILLVSWLLAVLCAWRYRFFNIIYNRVLLSAYLSLAKEKHGSS